MPIFKPKYSPEPKNFLKNFFKIFTHVWPKNFFKIFFRNFFVVKVEKKIIRGQTIVNEGILSHFYYKIFFTPQNVSSTRASALVIMSLNYSIIIIVCKIHKLPKRDYEIYNYFCFEIIVKNHNESKRKLKTICNV